MRDDITNKDSSKSDRTSPSDGVDRLDFLLEHGEQIANLLVAAGRRLRGRDHRRAKRLASYFRSNPSRDAVLRRPDVLFVCSVLLSDPDSRIEDVPPSQLSIALEHLDRLQSRPGRLFVLVGYPATVLMLGVVVAIGYLLLLVPTFDAMFREFELRLSPLTQLVIIASRWLTNHWGKLLTVTGVISLAVGLSQFTSLQESMPVWRRLRGLLRRPRRTAAMIASHSGLLVEVGMSPHQAIQFASRVHAEASPDAANGALLRHAFEHSQTFDDAPVAAELLHLVAVTYVDQSQTRENRWAAWLSPLSIVFVSVFVGLLVAALFMPMIDLIRSLSS